MHFDVFSFWAFRAGRSGDGGAEFARFRFADSFSPAGADLEGAAEDCVAGLPVK